MVDVRNGQPPMDNRAVARVFDDIAGLLEVQQDSQFKIRAYRNAARVIAAHPVELHDIVRKGGNLQDIRGIGEAISAKATELLTTGKLQYYEKLKQSVPNGVLELMRLPGIGPKTASRFVSQLGISSIDQLETAIRSGVTAGLPWFGVKKSQALLSEIETHRHVE